MKNRSFYSKVLAVSMILGQVTPIAQAVSTESNILAIHSEDTVDTLDNVDASGDSGENNDENTLENQGEEIGTEINWEDSIHFTQTFAESPSLFADSTLPEYYDDSWYDVVKTDYELADLDQFLTFAYMVNSDMSFLDKTISLTTDLDLTDVDWTPIGNTSSPFKGTFDGNQHIIANLTIDSGENEPQGLFGMLDGTAVVKNVILQDVSMEGQYFIGGIAALNYGAISNCGVTGSLKANTELDSQGSCVGGIVGKNLVEGNYYGTITNCYSQATISGVSRVGGIAGHNDSLATIENVYSVGIVSAEGDNYEGSLVGFNLGNIVSSYWLEDRGDPVGSGATTMKPVEEDSCFSFDSAGALNLPEPEDDSTDSGDSSAPSTQSNVALPPAEIIIPSPEQEEILAESNIVSPIAPDVVILPTEEEEDFTMTEQSTGQSTEIEAEDEEELEGFVYVLSASLDDDDNGTLLSYLNAWVEIKGHGAGYYTWHDGTGDNSYPVFHEAYVHIWSYGVDNENGTLTATCECGDEVVLSLRNMSYKGESFQFTDVFSVVESETDLYTDAFGGLYFSDGTNPVDVYNAQSYFAYVGEVGLSFTVEQAEISISWTGTNFKYDTENPQQQIPTTDPFGLVGDDSGENAEEIKLILSYKERDTEVDTASIEIGEYTAYAELENYTSNYKIKSGHESHDYEITELVLYTVSFESGSDDVYPDQVLAETDSNLTISKPEDPSRENFEFGGWYTDTTYSKQWDFSTSISSSMTLYAKWTAIHTVTYIHNDDENTVAEESVKDGEKIAQPTTLTKEGYVFGGWFTDEEFTDSWSFVNGTVTDDMTLYGKWTRQYIITFDSQGGSSVFSKTALEGGLVTAPTSPTYTDFYFMGWYTEASCINQWNFDSDRVSSDMTLYAKWDAYPTYQISFNSMGGSSVASQEVLIDELILEPDEPVLVGYTFLGWYTESELIYPWDFASSVPTADMTLYAKWEKTVYLTYGHVFSYDGEAYYGTQVSVYQNGVLIANTQADINGYFYFGNLSTGVYNIEYSIGTKTVTTAMEVYYHDHQELPDVFMPEYSSISTVSINPLTSVYAVAGLNTTTSYLTQSQGYYETFEIDLAVSNVVEESDKTLMESIISGYNRVIEYFDVSVVMNKNGGADESLTGTSNLIQIVMEIPLQYRYKDTYRVYRLHSDSLDLLTTTPNAIGEYIDVSYDGKFLSIYTKNFSTYCFTYMSDDKITTDSTGGEQSGSTETRIYNVTTQLRLNGTDTTETTMGNVSYSTSFPVYGTTVVVKPEPSYGYFVDYVTAVTSAGESLPVTYSTDGNYRFTQGLSPVTVTVAFETSRIETSYAQFTDVFSTDSYFEAVNRVVDAGLMTGTGNGVFSPHDTITRGMIVTILYNLSGEDYFGEASFWDVNEGDYFHTAVAWAQNNDVVMGYADGTFRPNQGITREELAVIFYSYCNYAQIQGPDWVYPTEYADNAQIGEWSKTAVAWCMNQGILDARADNIFYPQAFGTRAEVAVSLLSLL